MLFYFFLSNLLFLKLIKINFQKEENKKKKIALFIEVFCGDLLINKQQQQ